MILKLEEAPKGKRLIVCGGRNYGKLLNEYPSREARQADELRVLHERAFLIEVLDLLSPSEIAQGGAPGADSLARDWAFSNDVPCKTYQAYWQSEGRFAAGPKRNRRMFFDFAGDGTVAFKGGTGTADMERVTLEGGAWLVRPRMKEKAE